MSYKCGLIFLSILLVIDFGFAKQLGSKFDTNCREGNPGLVRKDYDNNALGTLAYMHPNLVLSKTTSDGTIVHSRHNEKIDISMI